MIKKFKKGKYKFSLALIFLIVLLASITLTNAVTAKPDKSINKSTKSNSKKDKGLDEKQITLDDMEKLIKKQDAKFEKEEKLKKEKQDNPKKNILKNSKLAKLLPSSNEYVQTDYFKVDKYYPDKLPEKVFELKDDMYINSLYTADCNDTIYEDGNKVIYKFLDSIDEKEFMRIELRKDSIRQIIKKDVPEYFSDIVLVKGELKKGNTWNQNAISKDGKKVKLECKIEDIIIKGSKKLYKITYQNKELNLTEERIIEEGLGLIYYKINNNGKIFQYQDNNDEAVG